MTVPASRRSELSLPSQAPLPAAADPAFDRIARLARTVLGVPIAMVTMVDENRQVMPGAVGLPDEIDQARELPLTMSLCQHVVRDAAPLVVVDAVADARVSGLAAVSEAGVRAYAGMPIINAARETVGSLCAVDVETRQWSEDELSLLEDLARTCSAELQMRELAARAEASRLHTQALLDLSESLSSTTSVVEVAARVQSLAARHLGADFGGITLLDAQAATLTYVDVSALHPLVQSAFRSFSLHSGVPSAAAVRTAEPIFIASTQEFAERFPTTADAAAATGESFAYLPLLAGGRAIGSLSMTWTDERRFSVEDEELLTAFGRYSAQAVERAVLLAERHDTAWTLQHALLPQLPTIDGFELAGRYRPARRSDAVGGDWYDAFELGDGSVIVVVGDVAGHDTTAAAAMGQLRATLRALAIGAPQQPSATLSELDRVMRSLGHARLATALLGSIRSDGGTTVFTWSNAGHPPPLLLEPDRPAAFLQRDPDRLLGLRMEPATRHSHRVELTAGSTVLLYTDGLIERRDRSVDEGLQALQRVVDHADGTELAALLDAVETIAAVDEPDDDVTDHDDTVVFAIRRTR